MSTLKIDPRVLSIFWELPESNEDKIKQLTSELILKLKELNTNSDGACGHLTYSVKRLIKGLASSRKAARQGFSVALCQLLRNFDCINTKDILTLTKENLKTSKQDAHSKLEAGNIYLGQVLSYSALLQAGRVTQDDDVMEPMLSSLLKIRTKRSYLRLICVNAISILISQASTERYKHQIFPHIKTEMQSGWQECSPDVLYMLMVSAKHHKSVIDKGFLKKNWMCSKVIHKDTYSNIWTVLCKSGNLYPVIHPAVSNVLESLQHSEAELLKFWGAGKDHFLKKGFIKGTCLGLHILRQMLPPIQSTEGMMTLLSPDLVQVLVRNKKDKSDYLYDSVLKTLSALEAHMKGCESGDTQVAIMSALSRNPDRLNDHQLQKSLDSMTQQFNKNGAATYGRYLIQFFNENINSVDNITEGDDTDKTKLMKNLLDLVSELRPLLTVPSLADDHEIHLEILQFLALHSYWKVVKPTDSIAHCQKSTENMNNLLRSKFKNIFNSALHSLLISRQGKNKTESTLTFIGVFHKLMKYMLKLLGCKDYVETLTPLSEEMFLEFNQALDLIKILLEKLNPPSSDGIGVGKAFELLILFSCLQLFINPEEAMETLEEVQRCSVRAMQDGKIQLESEEPHWMEVLTELLISMMSQPSSLTRVVSHDVYEGLVGHLTPASVSLLAEALTSDGSDDGAVAFEDDDEEMMDVDNLQEDSDEDMSDTSDEDESKLSNHGNDKSQKKESNGKKSKSKKSAKSQSSEDEDDEEPSDLDDDEMMKFDGALAAVFKEQKKGKEKSKKERKRQLVAFKNRLLDLVDVIIKSNPSPRITMCVLVPLLQVMVEGEKDKEFREIGNRASGVLKGLKKHAQIKGEEGISGETCSQSLEKILDFAENVINNNFLTSFSDAYCVVMKILKENGEKLEKPTLKSKTKKDKLKKSIEEPHSVALQLLKDKLTAFLHKKGTNIGPLFFINMFKKHNMLLWPLSESLIAAQSDDEVKIYQKTQACTMLVSMLTAQCKEVLDKKIWRVFIKSCQDVFYKVLLDMTEENYKPGYVLQVLTILHKLQALSAQEDFSLSEEVKTKLAALSHRFDKDTRKMYKSVTSERPTVNNKRKAKPTQSEEKSKSAKMS